MFYAEALDSRDRRIFDAGPYEEVESAIAAADDWAGTQALPTFIAEGLNVNQHSGPDYGSTLKMDGVLINRARVLRGGTGPWVLMYDTAALDFAG